MTSALDGVRQSASRPGRITPGEEGPGMHWIGEWVDPGANAEALEKIKILSRSMCDYRRGSDW
jgi:hypothetical protein